jgi:hypothetical protein
LELTSEYTTFLVASDGFVEGCGPLWVEVSSGSCPNCYFGYENPIFLTVDESDTDMTDLQDRDNGTHPFSFNSAIGLDFEIYCPSPPCYANVTAPSGLYDIQYTLIDHTSSLPACDAYDLDTAVFGIDTVGFGSGSLCLELTSEYTTFLVASDAFVEGCGPLWVEVSSGSCPAVLFT